MVNKLFDLTGKVALVTGSTHGLGYSIAKGLAQCGATLAIHARNPEKLEEALNQLKNEGIDAYGYLFDIRDAEEVMIGTDALEYELGRLDILVNNASINRIHPLEKFPEKDWNDVIDTNLTGVYKITCQAAKGMIERKSGKIINVFSQIGDYHGSYNAAYNVARGGLVTFTGSMALEWAKHNIQVNGISLGYFENSKKVDLTKDEKVHAKLCEKIPSSRFGNPEELVGAAVFLASNASSYLNGHVINVDGGMRAIC